MAFDNLTEEQKKYILENWDKESQSLIGEKLGLKQNEVSRFCIENGLRKRKFKFKGNKDNLLINTYPHVAKEWNYKLNKDIDLNEVPYGSKVKVWWDCPVGHSPYLATISHRTLSNSGCPICARQYKSSFPEQAIYYYIKKVFKDSSSAHVFSEIEFLEGDIFIPSLNLVIEYDGERFHRDKVKKDEYKNKIFNDNKIKLIRVREPRLPVLKKYGSKIVKRGDFKSFESLDKAIKEVLEFILGIFQSQLSTKIKEKIKETVKSINVSKDKGYIFQNLKFKLIKNSVYECFPELMDEWNEPLIDPKTISKYNDLPIKWKCRECGHKWTAVLKSRTGKIKAGCPKCSGNEKYTYKEVKEAFEKKGYILISKEYINANSYLEFRCEKHYDFGLMKVKFANVIQRNDNCKKCRYEKLSKKQIKYEIENIRKEFENRKLLLVSEKYISISENLEFICLKHKEKGTQTVQYANFKNVITPCKPCSRENAKITAKENSLIKKKAIELNYSDISFSLNRRNIEAYIEFICNKHKEEGKQKIERKKVLSDHFHCKYCFKAGENKK